MYNPDYPTSTGSFMQRTYNSQLPQAQESYYYNGVNPFQSAPSDSRRNIGMNTQPMMYQQPQSNFGQTQQFAESQLQPFSSYPPATPMNAPKPFVGLNMTNSRRNDTCVTGSIPNTTAPVNFAQAPVAQTMTPAPVNPYMSMYANYGMTVEPSMQSLYVPQPVNPVDRKACWENPYTQPRQIEQPVINWGQYAQQPTSPAMSLNPLAYTPQQMTQYAQQPQYPVTANQYPHADKTWLEIAKSNWGV